MIKLKTDARTPTLTYEQWTSLQDQLFMILGGDALDYMGRLPCDILKQQNDYLYAVLGHNHDDLYSVLGHNHNDLYSVLGHAHNDLYSVLGHNHNDLYSVLGHDHDDDYVPMAEGIATMKAYWYGDGSGARTINLTGSAINTIYLLQVLSSDGSNHAIGLYNAGNSAGSLLIIASSIFVVTSAWSYSAGASQMTIGSDLNTSGYSYAVFLLGLKTS